MWQMQNENVIEDVIEEISSPTNDGAQESVLEDGTLETEVVIFDY